MADILNMERLRYVSVGQNPDSLNYLGAKYKNIKHRLPAKTTFTIGQGFAYNAPGIAYKVFGSSDYWWVVLFYNGILNPLTDLYVGRVLQLPSMSDLNAYLSVAVSDSTATTGVI